MGNRGQSFRCHVKGGDPMHYNTVPDRGENLKRYRSIAKNQRDRILEFMKRSPDREFTPFEIMRLVMPATPITSVRRAMTDLESDGEIFKTGNKSIGDHGRTNNTWKVYIEPSQQMPLF